MRSEPDALSAKLSAELEQRDLFEPIGAICKARGVLISAIFGRRRTRSVSTARHEVWSRLRDMGWAHGDVDFIHDVAHTRDHVWRHFLNLREVEPDHPSCRSDFFGRVLQPAAW